MDSIRKFFQYAWPELALDGTPWRGTWQQSDRERFSNISRIFFVAAALGYLAHFFFFDVANDLSPLWAWGLFRGAAAVLCVVCFIFYSSRWVRVKYFRFPAMIVMAIGCHAQAQVTFFYSDAPWIYPFAFIFGAVLILQMSPLKSLMFSIPVTISCFSPLLAAGVEENALYSAAVFFCLVSALARTAQVFEIEAFLRENERDESRREVINLGKDFENRLKSFIPRVIAERIENRINLQNMSALEATIDVLQPKKMEVSCLFSDIRGFTQGSKDLDSFLLESAIPEVKACSDAVEDNRGIPRKIGDLIFAYFDSSNTSTNLLSAISAGVALSQLNKDFNDSATSVTVKRYILISTGDAIVGNVGGLNSGVEITALGSPVNFLSRLDDATKHPGLSKHLSPGDLLLCSRSAGLLKQSSIEFNLVEVDLVDEGVEIRDFEDTRNIFILRPSQAAIQSLSEIDLTAADT